MKRLFYLSLLFILPIFGCKEEGINYDLPYTTFDSMSPEFKFYIKSLINEGKGVPDSGPPFLAVINDEAECRGEIMLVNGQEYPLVDFSKHTVLALAITRSGGIALKPRKEGEKTILNVKREIPKYGPGPIMKFYAVVVPKVDSANVLLEIIDVKE